MIRSTVVMALAASGAAGASQPAVAQTATPYVAPIVAVPPPPSAPPPVTRALLPGHWQLDGARYVWVKPETKLRVVEGRPVVPRQNVWMDGRWVFIPTHYAPPY